MSLFKVVTLTANSIFMLGERFAMITYIPNFSEFSYFCWFFFSLPPPRWGGSVCLNVLMAAH